LDYVIVGVGRANVNLWVSHREGKAGTQAWDEADVHG
jgi:hypothetical protein